jgi:OOP family OmpA-OmpF porin
LKSGSAHGLRRVIGSALLLAVAVRPVRAEGGFQLDGLEHRAPGVGRLGVIEPSTLPAGGFSFRGVAAVLDAPLVLSPSAPGDDRVAGAVVSRRVGFHVAGAFAPTNGTAVHAGLPINYGTSTGRYGDATREALARSTAGDARLGGTIGLFSLLGLARPLELEIGLDATFWLPTGDPASLTGEGTLRAQPTASVSAGLGPLAAAATVGWHIRPTTSAYNVRRDDEFRLGAVVSSALPFLGARLSAALHGAVPTVEAARPFDPTTGAVGPARATTAVYEALLGLEVRSDDGFLAELGVGRGLTDAAGSPAGRGWLSLGYVLPAADASRAGNGPDRDTDGVPDAEDACPYEAEDVDGERDTDGCPEGPPAGYVGTGIGGGGAPGPAPGGVLPPLPPLQPLTDLDADGVTDDVDACPGAPEDVDGFTDLDGCPDPDHDGDAIPDGQDACPSVAETPNGLLDADGCPDLGPDADADGIEDRLDACPNLPETKDGRRDDDGCPESADLPGALPPLPPLPLGANVDADALPDGDDRCPNAAEDLDGFEDADGCPDPDDDGDGLADTADACPRMAENVDGWLDGDGCPEPAAPDAEGLVGVVGALAFAPGAVQLAPGAGEVLDRVAALLRAQPTVTLRIDAYAEGTAAVAPRELASRRAADLRAALIDRGVAPERVVARGLGAATAGRIELHYLAMARETPP